MKKIYYIIFILLFSFNLQAKTLEDVKRAAFNSDPEALMDMGTIYEKGLAGQKINIEKAKEYYLKAAQNGLTYGYAFAGEIEYSSGDQKKALQNWQKGIELEDPLSQAYMGRHYFNKGNFYKANPLLKTAAIKGIPIAQFYLSKIYEFGKIGAKNIVYAHAWMTISARNYPKAKEELKDMERRMNSNQIKVSNNISEKFIKKYFDN